jgi:hypothetical protein
MAIAHITGGLKFFGRTAKVVKTPFENERREAVEI